MDSLYIYISKTPSLARSRRLQHRHQHRPQGPAGPEAMIKSMLSDVGAPFQSLTNGKLEETNLNLSSGAQALLKFARQANHKWWGAARNGP